MYYSNKSLIWSIFCLVTGLALVILSAAGVLDSSVYSAMGSALTVIGIVRLIRIFRYRTDAVYREKIDVDAGDERNRYLRLMSWAWTGYIVVLVEGIGAIAAIVLGERTIQLVLSYSVCLIMVVYLGAYLILNKKY